MKTKMIITVITMMLLAPFIFAAEENTEEWLNKHAAIRTTETVSQDGKGNIQTVRVVTDTTVYIRQTSTEIKKPDKNGNLQTISRTTTSIDALGGTAVTTETLLAGSSTLVTTAITTTERVDGKLITTNYARGKTGNMTMISKTTSKTTDNGGGTITASF
jgi:hypothetical protein